MSKHVGQTWVQHWRSEDCYYVVLGDGRPYTGDPEHSELTYMLLNLVTGKLDRVKQTAFDDEDTSIWTRLA